MKMITSNKETLTEIGYLQRKLKEKDAQILFYKTAIKNFYKHDKGLKLYSDSNEIYNIWIKLNELDEFELEQQKKYKFNYAPLISIIMPVYNPPEDILKEAINSVINQIYPNWELCIADDASTKPYVKDILEYYKNKNKKIKVIYRNENGHISKASNSALELASGDYIALMDHDDMLHETALFFAVKEINDYPEVKLIYSDEDKLNKEGVRTNPYFKCDFNPDLFLSQNMISHLGVYNRLIVNEIGGFREGYEGSQDYDMALRFIEKIKYSEIRHIPRVLYHWRMAEGSTASIDKSVIDTKPYCLTSARQAVQDHLDRLSIKARVVEAPLMPAHNRTIYKLPYCPLVSIIIITHNGYLLIKDLIKSIFEKTSYKNFEIILINRDSNDLQTLEYLKLLNKHEKINVIDYNMPFNYSKVVNFAVKFANGEVIAILNDDMIVVNNDWLRELVSHALRHEIGVVGAKLLYPDDTIQHAGVIIGLEGIAGHAHYHMSKDDPGYFGRANLLQNYSAVTGACMAIRKKLYEEAGGMDENLAVAYNDIDFCIKVMQLGYYNVYTPYASLYHYESKTRGYEDTVEKKIRFKKEMDYFKTKWGKIIEHDFAYSLNLSLKPGFLFSIPLPKEWIII